VDGLRCPITGHVRRANPRTGDQPGGNLGPIRKLAGMLGFGIDRRADTIASSRYHRLLRRGRKYGAGADAGLHFICLGASIARQFEFVHGAWLESAKFGGLSGEQDPLLGSRQPRPDGHPTDAFRWPQRAGPCREIAGVPQFVTVSGGAYFFLPGVAALKRIAAL
jgi:deferrochelatase/peroxidase EfeB